MVESRINFVRVAEYRQIFLRLDIFFCTYRKTAATFNHRLYVVLDTTIKCIWIKTQLIVEFDLVFQGFANIIYPPQKSTTNGRILGQFCAVDKMQTIFYNLVYFYNRQETVGGINHRLYYVVNITP